tara:strand:- start:3339 stop:4181 length:843 start_codon:yes stop_codon:yes gene_type:complete
MLFDLRLNVLNDYVDKFIVIEAKHSHSGKKKKLNFDIDSYKNFKDRIIYKVIENEPDGIKEINPSDTAINQSNQKRLNSLKRIEQSYDTAIECLKDANPDDIFCLNDSDEIPKYENFNFKEIKNDLLIAKLKLCYFKFNLYYDLHPWLGTRACKIKNLLSPTWLKYVKPKKYPFWRIDTFFSKTKYMNVRIIEDGGWHFSNLKTPEEIEDKMLNFGHHNEVEDSGIGLKDIKNMITEKKVIFAHNRKPDDPSVNLSRLSVNELPKYVNDNLEKYNDWLEK